MPTTPADAAALFGDRLDVAEHFAALLATTGVDHGLIGPREVPRLWDRHLLNCAVVVPALGQGERVIDVGSGAGLPGLVWAVARPDLDVHLVEPLLRRTTWLQAAVDELGLDNVSVHRGKAEAFWDELTAPVVTARAVARLADLAAWCLPLLEPGGALLALKGASAATELDEDAPELARLGAAPGEVLTFGAELLEVPTRVVRVPLGPAGVATRASGSRRGGKKKSAKRR